MTIFFFFCMFERSTSVTTLHGRDHQGSRPTKKCSVESQLLFEQDKLSPQHHLRLKLARGLPHKSTQVSTMTWQEFEHIHREDNQATTSVMMTNDIGVTDKMRIILYVHTSPKQVYKWTVHDQRSRDPLLFLYAFCICLITTS